MQETYGETIGDLDRATTITKTATIRVRKVDIPPLVVKKLIRRVVPRPRVEPLTLVLQKPDLPAETEMVRTVLSLGEQPNTASVLAERGEYTVRSLVGRDLFAAATDLATIYRLPALQVLRELRRLYEADAAAESIVPDTHLPALARQIEAQISGYTLVEEEVEEALALVRLDGFEAEVQDGALVYTAEIVYQTGKESLLLSWRQMSSSGETGDVGFHYDPYNFDSDPEEDFFLKMLHAIGQHPDEVEDIYFTGAITDPGKTDFYVEYKGTDDRWHRYSPDFVIRRKDRRAVIVEVKAERERSHPVDGENGRKAMAVRKWIDLNPDRLHYEMVFTSGAGVGLNQVDRVIKAWEEE